MSENKIKFPAKLASNNPQSFGIVDATETSGHRSVDAISELYDISDSILSILKDGSDAIGQEWFVVSEDCKYRLDNWEGRKSASGWTKLPKQELINTKQSISEKDQPNGYAGLDSNGKLPIEKTYGDTATVVEVETYELLPVTGLSGVIYYVSNTSAQYKWSGSAYVDITDGADNAKKNETSIFDCSNGTSTKYYSSLSAAINVVPPVYRTSNRIISYLSTENATTTAVNYQYHGIDSTTWTDLTKWKRIPNQSDLAEIRSELAAIASGYTHIGSEALSVNGLRNINLNIGDSSFVSTDRRELYGVRSISLHTKMIATNNPLYSAIIYVDENNNFVGNLFYQKSLVDDLITDFPDGACYYYVNCHNTFINDFSLIERTDNIRKNEQDINVLQKETASLKSDLSEISGGVQKITGSIGVMYDNNSLSLQNLQKSYYGEFKAGKKISLKALNVTSAGSGWYNIALFDYDEKEYIIVLNQPTNGVYEEITLERDCTHLRVDINASNTRMTCDIDYCLEYNLLTESTKAELTSLQKKQIALNKGIILSSENNYAKTEQILLFNAYSSNSIYRTLTLGVIDKRGSVYGIQMFDSGNLIDNGDFTATINGTIAHIKGWLNKGIAYIDVYFDTETYVQIASANSGLIIPLQDAALLNEQATPYDSSILTESGLMNSRGVVGDTSFHHSPKISLDGVSNIWLTTNMAIKDSNYARIVFFKGNEVTNAYSASSGGVTSDAFKQGLHWQNADSFVVNCYNSSFSNFSMTVCKNTLTETENILNTHIRHNTPYIVDANGNGDFSSLTEAVSTLKDINDVTLLVNDGTYNLISEFEALYGSDFFTNYPLTEPPLNKKGIVLNNRVKIIFSSNSKVTCNYTGSNTGVMKYFSPFNAGKYGFELIGLNLECSNVRYGIHDERYNGGDNANVDDYTNIYRYCSIKLDNRNSQGIGTNQCIGGGLGYQGNIIIEGCYFESQVSNDSIVSYHNHTHANSKSKIVANNNYIAGTNGFRFSWYGASTLITDIFLSGNSVGKATVVKAETQDATINNISVTEWNTNLRN